MWDRVAAHCATDIRVGGVDGGNMIMCGCGYVVFMDDCRFADLLKLGLRTWSPS